jgi:apolipoprotein N-acyltransferase
VRSKVSNLLRALPQTRPAVRAGVAFLLGASATLAMPPWHLWPVIWIALPAFLFLIEITKTKREAFFLGWAFGFGHFATGFAWIGNAFFVDRETFAALAVPAIGGLAAGFALYFGFVALATRLISPLKDQAWPHTKFIRSVCQLCLFAAAWALVEWWRGWFMTGLPWNPLGSIWVAVPALMQGASLMGVYGLSLLTVIAAAACFLFIPGAFRRATLITVMLCHLPLVTVALWGTLRLNTAELGSVPGVMLRLVQPNIAQADKWRPGFRERHLLEQVQMSTTNADNVTHVLWAETAVPFPLNQAAGALAATAQAAPAEGYVLTGAPRIEGQLANRRAYNSLFAVAGNGTIAAVYDKAHLVPFGEYMPLQELIPLPQLTGGTGFTPGIGRALIALPGLPAFSPLICYEIIFSGAVTGATRPAWLFNLTNDAWFGDSSGPHQHLASAQLRAVEEGLPVVRVANTGISAVIDGYGHISGQIELGKKGVLDSQLPLDLPPTLFSRFGHWPFLAFTLAFAAGAIALSRKSEKID